ESMLGMEPELSCSERGFTRVQSSDVPGTGGEAEIRGRTSCRGPAWGAGWLVRAVTVSTGRSGGLAPAARVASGACPALAGVPWVTPRDTPAPARTTERN